MTLNLALWCGDCALLGLAMGRAGYGWAAVLVAGWVEACATMVLGPMGAFE